MSQYAGAVLDRSFPPTASSYYQRPGAATNADGSIVTIPLSTAQCPQHQSQSWPQYFTEHHPLPQSSSLPSYGSSSDPSTSTPACMPYASNSTSASFANTAEGVSHFHEPQQTFNAQSRSLDYQITPQPLSTPYYPTSSQCTLITPPSPQPSTFPLSYGFRNTRDSSPSSHTSASDFEIGAREWESPGHRSEDLNHQLFHRGASEEGESAGHMDEVGSRLSSSAEPTTTSVTAHPSVKLEPDDPDGCFIMVLSSMPDLSAEFEHSTSDRTTYKSNLLSQSLAPPTEVPLRATQASKEMRGMMGVFRLNPFAMHSLSVNGDGSDSPSGLEGGKAHPLWGGEAHPLDEEPLVFEFQLNINGVNGEAEQESSNVSEGKGELTSSGIRSSQGLDATDQLRSFSPSFSLHPDDLDVGSISPRGRDRRSIARISESEYEDDDQGENSWPDAGYSSRSEQDTSSTTTRSVHTPFNDSPLHDIHTPSHGVYEPHQEQPYSSPSSSPWDAVNEQYHVEDTQFMPPAASGLSEIPKTSTDYGHASMKIPRLHTTASHPYLRKSLHNYQPTHGHSQSLSQGPAHSLSYVQPVQHSDVPILRFSTLHPQQNYTHISTQSSHNQGFSPPRAEHHGHIPSYPSMTSVAIASDGQNIVGPSQPSYRFIGRVRETRDKNHDHEEPLRVYTPSNASSASNDISGYSQPSETSMHLSSMHAHGSAMNLASNRRWSLPETGASIGHGVGNSGPFLSS